MPLLMPVSGRLFLRFWRALPSTVSLATAAALLVGPIPARAAWAASAHVAPAPEQVRTSVLGLEGPDEQAAQRLTDALRSAFAEHGMAGGKELTLMELRLTMGCETNDPQCLGEGGQAIDVEKMVYGQLLPSGDGYELQLSLLDVASAQVEARTVEQLDAATLEDADATKQFAQQVVKTLVEPTEPEQPTPAADMQDAGHPAPDPGDAEPTPEPDQEGGLVWGMQERTPAWKWAALGTSAGLTLAALGTAIGTGVYLQGPLRDELLQQAEESLDPNDGSQSNDIDPDSSRDLCDWAQEPVGGGVRNRDVTIVCRRGERLEKVNLASWVFTGVFAATTVVFTTLLFVHRRDGGLERARRRGFRIGVAPLEDGGVMVGGGMRF